ncbi:MAG TPA: hypothetical protein VJN70_14735 [Gemmatimonadaceae bacterium]|nr:hypothetical protein [Gemmatimonadaceae bacterium]
MAIVKNEASNIRTTLESVKPFVDSWTILDTCSTDDTQVIICETMGGPGSLYTEPFVDFATTRNRVLGLADRRFAPTFTLMLSGDEVLQGGDALRAYLQEHINDTDGAYCIQIQSGNRQWMYPRVLRTSADWRYVGVRHERPVGPKGEVRGPIIPGVTIIHRESDPARKIRRIREEDLPLLTKQVEDESIPLDERANSIFFLAETHALLANECKDEPGGPKLSHQMAAMALYQRYAAIAHDPSRPAYDETKVHYALFLYYHVAEQVDGLFTHEELEQRLGTLAQLAPREPGIHLLWARHAACVDVRRGLFVAEKAAAVAKEAKANPGYDATDERFEWLALSLAAGCAKQMQSEKIARELAQRGLDAGGPKEAFSEFLT